MTEKKVTNYPYKFNGKNYRCPGDKIFIRPIPPKMKGNIEIDLNLINDKDLLAFSEEHPFIAEVVAVGDGIIAGLEGMKPPQVKVGDIVLYDRNVKAKVKINLGQGVEELCLIYEHNCYFIQQKEK